MYLSDDQALITRRIIRKLYTERFDEKLLHEVAASVCKLVEAHYFSFNLIIPRQGTRQLIVSNNPADFIPIYLSLADHDFLLESIVQTHGDYVASKMPYDVPENREFLAVVQKARPISDIVYEPLILSGNFCGFWGAARAGLSSRLFSDTEIELFRYVTWFLRDAFERSLIPPPLEEEVAYLDWDGRIVSAGEKIRKTFDTIFVSAGHFDPYRMGDDPRNAFLRRFRAFLNGPFRAGMDRCRLRLPKGTRTFLFSLLRPLSPFVDGLPFASVRLLQETDDGRILGTDEVRRIIGQSRFTPREREVILGIYRGKSNKVIAYDLGIDESTVKRHTHNIYEKSGFKSRVELVLGLASLR